MRRPKRRAARKRRSVREACRGRPREAADCSKWPAAGRVGLFIKAVRPKRRSVRKVALPEYEDCAARVWRLRCSGVRRSAHRDGVPHWACGGAANLGLPVAMLRSRWSRPVARVPTWSGVCMLSGRGVVACGGFRGSGNMFPIHC